MNAKFLRPDIDLVNYISENRRLIVRNKGRGNATNLELYNKAMQLVSAGLLKVTHWEETKSGQRWIVVELA